MKRNGLAWLLAGLMVLGLARVASAGVDNIFSPILYTQESSSLYLVDGALNISQGYTVTLASGETVFKLEVSVVGATVNADSGTCFNESGFLVLALSSSVTGGGMTSVAGANGEYNHYQFFKFGQVDQDTDRTGFGAYVDYTPRTSTFTVYVGKPNRSGYLPAATVGCPGNGSIFRIRVWKGRRTNLPVTTSMLIGSRPAAIG